MSRVTTRFLLRTRNLRRRYSVGVRRTTWPLRETVKPSIRKSANVRTSCIVLVLPHIGHCCKGCKLILQPPWQYVSSVLQTAQSVMAPVQQYRLEVPERRLDLLCYRVGNTCTTYPALAAFHAA